MLGPQAPSLLHKYLQNLISTPGYENLQISGLQENFCDLLQKSSLSISLGGYSLVDVVYTKTPGLCYPAYYHDQYLRPIKFAEKGLVHILKEEDLQPERLAQKITEILQKPYPNVQINMNGVQNSKLGILKLLNPKI